METPKADRLTRPVHGGFFTFPTVLMAIIAAKAFWTCRGNLVDTDLWWHLRNARYIVSNFRLPNVDSYSFTAAGAAWVDHSWLSELIYHAGYQTLGMRGVFVIFAISVAVIGIAIFQLCVKRAADPLVAGLAAVFGGLLAGVGFTPRAQNFGWLCFVALFAILLRFRDTRNAPLWLIPPLFTLWINLHGGWPMGMVIFGLIFGSGLIPRYEGRLTSSPWTSAEIRRMLSVFAASIAALFVNPYGWRLVRYPFDLMLSQKFNVAIGSEWASINFNDRLGAYALVTLAAVFAAALFPKGRWRIDDAVLTAFVVFCGLTHIRFLVMTGIVLPPLLVRHLPRLSSYDPSNERRIVNASILGIIALAMVLAFPAEQTLTAQVNAFFPASATNYLKANHGAGNIFNQYEWGGYVEWFAPEIPTFIDTRTDIFEYNGVLADYFSISTFQNTDDLLDKYSIGYVIYPAGTPLAYYLSKSSRWERAYSDHQAVIYKRRHEDSLQVR